MNVQPERVNLLDFFDRLPNSQFVIPVYQRNYIWSSKKQVKKFLDDCSKLINGTKKKHFLGIMMYLTIPRGIGFNELSVVDGQQRLITLFLILHALKEIACENGNTDFADEITRRFLTNTFAKEDSKKLRLKPLVSEDGVYEKIINGKFDELSAEEKKSNVYVNYAYIKSYMKNMFGGHPLETMQEAINKFYIVAIPLDEADNAQEIFETINSAGAELSKSDLIRNYILMNLTSEEQEKLYNNYWRPLEALFEKNGKITNYFRMFLANRKKELPNMDDLYSVFQGWFDEEIKAGKSKELLLQLLLKYAKYYSDLFILPDCSISAEIDMALQEFKKSTMEPTAPLLMEIYSLYDTKNTIGNQLITAEDFANIISLFNTYNIRRNICNLRTGVLTRIIPPMLKDIINTCGGNYENIYNICVRYLVDSNKGKASFMPDDAYLRANLTGMNAYGLKNYFKIVFEKIESYNNPAIVNFDNLSIEHLMPQTPTEEWLTSLKINQEEYEFHLHRIGNLTLATHSDNSKMSNNPFEYKKKILSDTSHLKMNMEILEKESWTVEDIDERTKQMIEKICELYPYQSYSMEDVIKYEIFNFEDNNRIHAYLYEDYSVEIQPDSYFEISKIIGDGLQELLNEEVIVSKDRGYLFNQAYTFEDLKTASELLLNSYSDDEWEEWVDSNSMPLNIDLRTRLMNIKKKSKK